MHFEEGDEFSVADLVDCLRYVSGELRFAADYVRGRCMKTDVTVRPDGTATLATRCRGEAATRWVGRLKGKKVEGEEGYGGGGVTALRLECAGFGAA